MPALPSTGSCGGGDCCCGARLAACPGGDTWACCSCCRSASGSRPSLPPLCCWLAWLAPTQPKGYSASASSPFSQPVPPAPPSACTRRADAAAWPACALLASSWQAACCQGLGRSLIAGIEKLTDALGVGCCGPSCRTGGSRCGSPAVGSPAGCSEGQAKLEVCLCCCACLCCVRCCACCCCCWPGASEGQAKLEVCLCCWACSRCCSCCACSGAREGQAKLVDGAGATAARRGGGGMPCCPAAWLFACGRPGAGAPQTAADCCCSCCCAEGCRGDHDAAGLEQAAAMGGAGSA